MLIENIAGFQVLEILNIVVTVSDFIGAMFGLISSRYWSRKTMNLVYTGGLCVSAVVFVAIQTLKVSTLAIKLVILGKHIIIIYMGFGS